MRLSVQTADVATVRRLDSMVMFWVVLWLAVAIWSGYTIWQVSHIGDTITNSGSALDAAGRALETVGQVPVVGSRPAELGEQVVATATEVAARGQAVEARLRRLEVLLGVSIAVMPNAPVLGLYLPQRLARRRELAELRRALTRHGRDPMMDRYLAERAIRLLPYTTIRAITPDPWDDIAAGRAERLADAELARLGLSPQGQD
ncbi:hypothetical protein BH18ACT8_BH18ACT8_09690 [soil metagenome]